MPLVRITVASGLPSETRRALGDAAHKVLVEVAYMGIPHRAPIAFVQVFMNAGRTVEVKQALYAALAAALSATGGFKKEDVIVNLVEVARENWSFGGGLMSYPPQP